MNVRRNYIWLAVVAVVVVGLAIFAVSKRSPAPFARPIPGSKWTSATTEPDVRVYMSDTGSIKTMKFEKYIEGVVAAEMDPQWPLEALKAQAIVARTFAIEELERRGGVAATHPGADVSTSFEEFQAYNASRVNDSVRRAVQETRGQIVTYQGKPIRAWFHADAGGQTALPEEGLKASIAAAGPFPYLRSVKVPWTAPNTDWTATFSREELRTAAARSGKDPGSFSTVALGTKGPSGRTIDIVIGGAKVPAVDLREALGSTRMKSTLLTSLTMSGDKVTMKGKGYGHGVGLAQWGARGMASQGKPAQDIITYFFSGARLSKLWS